MSNPSERPDRTYGLPELARAAAVSPRTVRYYIAEGLLPPPRLAGPTTAYGPGHLDRLRLIGRLKAAYLPLKEIRRRLAGLGDDEVRALLAEETGPTAPIADESDDAATYLERVLGPRSAPGAAHRAGFERREPPPLRMEMAPLSEPEERPPTGHTGMLLGAVRFAESPAPPQSESGAWRRIALGDDAELLIREEAYRRRRDRVEWLVRWARRVFG